jgi:hypothetical protein
MMRMIKRIFWMTAFIFIAVTNSNGDVFAGFNSYAAPYTISEATSPDATAISTSAALTDTDDNSTFTVWGSTGTGAGNSYSMKVLGDNTGSNYLSLKDSRASAGNPLAAVSTTGAYSLNEARAWSVDFAYKPNGAVNGNLFFGLYAGSAMSASGGYTVNQLNTAGNTASASVLQLMLTGTGAGAIARTGTGNAIEYWNGSGWQSATVYMLGNGSLDATGATQYRLSLSVDSGNVNLTLVDLATSSEKAKITSAIADMGTNITTANTARFSAGELGSNTAQNWETDIYALTVNSLAAPPVSSLGLYVITGE